MPHPIEIRGQRIRFGPAQGQDTVASQTHIAHFGEVMNWCGDEHRRAASTNPCSAHKAAAPTPGMAD